MRKISSLMDINFNNTIELITISFTSSIKQVVMLKHLKTESCITQYKNCKLFSFKSIQIKNLIVKDLHLTHTIL